MSSPGKNENVLWLAEYYSLAKCFPDAAAWMSLLDVEGDNGLKTFQRWLWKEIWVAAQSEETQVRVPVNR
jgi:hypothetical protein